MSKGDIAAIVLAAGRGTRMESDRPKVLHPLAGRPMIAHLMESLGRLRPERIVVVVGTGMEAVAEAVAPHPAVVQEPRLGTAHAALAAKKALKGFAGDVLVVFGADPLITPATMRRLIKARRAKGDPAAVVLGFRPDDAANYGRLIVGGDGSLEAIVEARDATPAERRIGFCNSGLMAVDSAVLFRLFPRHHPAFRKTPQTAGGEIDAQARRHLVEKQAKENHHDPHHFVRKRLLIIGRRRREQLLMKNHHRNGHNRQQIEVRPQIKDR